MMKKLLVYFFPIFMFGSILSPLQQQLLQQELKKVEVSGNKLKNSWINPVTLQYKYNQTNQTPTLQKTNSFFIGINQPIFKSGAIWASVKYANFMKSENMEQVKLQKRTLIKQAYEILFNIKKIEITIQKQKLLIDNAKIDIQRKKEQFLSGVSDSSFLDNAIINKNNLELSLRDLKLQKERLIDDFKNLSDLNYKMVKLPKFNLISKAEYLNNLNLQIAKKEIRVKRALKNMNIGNSFISINLIANYNWLDTKYDNPSVIYKNDNTNFYNIGVSITLPLDVNFFKTIQESKIEYLKSTLKYEDEIVKANNEYDIKIKNIENLNKKIKIYQNTIKTYQSLVLTTKDNIKAGVNTILDLKNLENSLNINKLNVKSLKIEKEIDLLNLYYLVKGFE